MRNTKFASISRVALLVALLSLSLTGAPEFARAGGQDSLLAKLREARTLGGGLRLIKPSISPELHEALDREIRAIGPRAHTLTLAPLSMDGERLMMALRTHSVVIEPTDQTFESFRVGQAEIRFRDMKDPQDLIGRLREAIRQPARAALQNPESPAARALAMLLGPAFVERAEAEPPAMLQDAGRALITGGMAVLAPRQYAACRMAVQAAQQCEQFISENLRSSSAQGGANGEAFESRVRELADRSRRLQEGTFSNTRNGIRQNCVAFSARGERPVADRLERCIRELSQRERAMRPVADRAARASGQPDPIGEFLRSTESGAPANPPAPQSGSGAAQGNQ